MEPRTWIALNSRMGNEVARVRGMLSLSPEAGSWDLVLPWVNSNVPGFMEEVSSFASAPEHLNPERYRDDVGLLRSALRSFESYAGELGSLWLVLPDERHLPDWLDTSASGLQVLFHHQFLPPESLPCYNSNALALALAWFDGISEEYLYTNDDYLIASPVRGADFVDRNGLERAYLATWNSPAAHLFGAGKNRYDNALSNTNSCLDQLFGTKPRKSYRHKPLLMKKSVWRSVSRHLSEQIEKTIGNRFRASADLVPEHLYVHWLLHSGQARAVSRLKDRWNSCFIMAQELDYVAYQLAKLALLRPKFVCINDDMGEQPQAGLTDLLSWFLDSFFPEPSRFERR